VIASARLKFAGWEASMYRREFIWLLGGATTLPLGVGAQPSTKVPHVVHLSPAFYPAQIEVYRSQFKGLGYIEGRSIRVEFQNTQGVVDQLPMLAEKLVQGGGIDVILAESTPAALAAHRATQIIPIVAFVAHDPVASGLVKSLARPGGNVTGISFFAAETTAKRVELMREVVPRALRIGVVVTKVNEGAESLGVAFETGRKLGLTVEVVTVDDAANLAKALSLTRLSEYDAFVFVPDVVLSSHMAEVVKLIARSSKPVIYPGSEWVEAGGFMSFGTDIQDARRRVVAQLDRVLKGEKPGDLPFERATKFQLGINLPAARMLGIEPSPSLLARADKVIE
jgi:putative tryptophan/tyrosine transport system substrate-binding protein